MIDIDAKEQFALELHGGEMTDKARADFRQRVFDAYVEEEAPSETSMYVRAGLGATAIGAGVTAVVSRLSGNNVQEVSMDAGIGGFFALSAVCVAASIMRNEKKSQS